MPFGAIIKVLQVDFGCRKLIYLVINPVVSGRPAAGIAAALRYKIRRGEAHRGHRAALSPFAYFKLLR
ncbi:hypothetical protein CDA63_04285 [Hymenobacter amundsenii]|uniref:Uncharacterized protein n=1 Tax=Hymenobacter amundsenii TaxID=2006685 RepID=A0A246FR65_9BACT|nr:hypothetical protein CDA63_04285 [Hymenobacter amundsenii]